MAGTAAGAGTVRSLGPAIALGALKRVGSPWGKGAGGVQGTPYRHGTLLWGGGDPATHLPPPPALSASETGEDVSFWRMPPLIPNNAPDGPARTSLVRDVARSELVPGREAERGDRDPHGRWHQEGALQQAIGLPLLLIYNNSISLRRRGGSPRVGASPVAHLPFACGRGESRLLSRRGWLPCHHHHHVGHPHPCPGWLGQVGAAGMAGIAPREVSVGDPGQRGPFLIPGCWPTSGSDPSAAGLITSRNE